MSLTELLLCSFIDCNEKSEIIIVKDIFYIRDYKITNILNCKTSSDRVCESEGNTSILYTLCGEINKCKQRVNIKMILKKITNKITIEFILLDIDNITMYTIGSVVLRINENAEEVDVEVKNGGIKIEFI